MRKQVIILCKNEILKKIYCKAFKMSDYQIVLIETPDQLKKVINGASFSLIIMDIDDDNPHLIKDVRAIKKDFETHPLVIVGEKEKEDMVIELLENGAISYIEKPINIVTFPAMIKAVNRRAHFGGFTTKNKVCLGPFEYHMSYLRLWKNGEEIHLSNKENCIMKLFFDNPNRVISIQKICETVWCDNPKNKNLVMVYISRLRRKIEDDMSSPRFIQNVRGSGYIFVV